MHITRIRLLLNDGPRVALSRRFGQPLRYRHFEIGLGMIDDEIWSKTTPWLAHRPSASEPRAAAGRPPSGIDR